VRNAIAAERGEVPPIPENSITKPPSAELRPGQLDTDTLPTTCCWTTYSTTTSRATAATPTCWPPGSIRRWWKRVLHMVDAAEYKRRIPPGTKISLKAFRPRPPPADHNCWRERAAIPSS